MFLATGHFGKQASRALTQSCYAHNDDDDVEHSNEAKGRRKLR